MRKSAIVLVIMVVIICLYIWVQSNEKLSTVLPIERLLEISKSALSHIMSLAGDLLLELARRAGEAISAISMEIFKILVRIASDLDTRFQSVLHRPII